MSLPIRKEKVLKFLIIKKKKLIKKPNKIKKKLTKTIELITNIKLKVKVKRKIKKAIRYSNRKASVKNKRKLTFMKKLKAKFGLKNSFSFKKIKTKKAFSRLLYITNLRKTRILNKNRIRVLILSIENTE